VTRDDANDKPGGGPTLDELRAALAESEQRYRNLFDNSVLGIYRTTPDGQVLMANPALLRMLGYSSFEELAARDLERGDFEPRYPRSRFKEKIEAEGEIVGLESVWIKRDRTALFVRENARVVRDQAGRALCYEGTIEDISERKRAEEKLRGLLAELSRVAERDRMKNAGRIAAGIVADLESAIGAIDGVGDGAEPRDVRAIIETAARSVLMISSELDPPQLDEVPLETAIEELVAAQGTVSGLRIDFRDDGLAKPLEEDIANLLLTAVRELLQNVFKHARAKRCRVALEKDKSQVKLTVEDDGIGFDPAGVSAASPFGIEGVVERVEVAGGSVEIKSSPGRGTRITIHAPMGIVY
jgi:PAS domain S-box-containing protein